VAGLAADACCIDDTGGFGSSSIDKLRRLGRHPIGRAGSAASLASER
jgi:hypothetical protein